MKKNVNKNFRPTVEWMSVNYEKLNKELFNGELPECNFNIFHKERPLGCFSTKCRYEKYGRKMFIVNDKYEKVYIDRNNIYDYAHPEIQLNASYSGSEHSFKEWLVHEMCHYYNCMDGHRMLRPHGREFHHIGDIVYARSNGKYKVTTTATEETFNEVQLDKEIQKAAAKVKNQRISKQKERAEAFIGYQLDGKVILFIAKDRFTIHEFVTNIKNDNMFIKLEYSDNPSFIDFLFSKGYNSLSRKYYRYYFINNKFVEDIHNNFYLEEIFAKNKAA